MNLFEISRTQDICLMLLYHFIHVWSSYLARPMVCRFFSAAAEILLFFSAAAEILLVCTSGSYNFVISFSVFLDKTQRFVD
jgi:hypothetical protein